MTFWFKEVSLQSMVVGFPASRPVRRSFEYEEHAKDGKWTVILKHGSGARWSIYYEELLKTPFPSS